MAARIEDYDYDDSVITSRPAVLGVWWSGDDSMRVLRNLVPDIDSLDLFNLLAKLLLLRPNPDDRLRFAIKRELQIRLGRNCSEDLIRKACMEIRQLLRRKDRQARGDHSVETELSAEVIFRLLKRRSNYHCEEKKVCSICLVDLDEEEGKDIARLDCEHEYHACCVTEWLLRGKNQCPLCGRMALDLDSDDIFLGFC